MYTIKKSLKYDYYRVYKWNKIVGYVYPDRAVTEEEITEDSIWEVYDLNHETVETSHHFPCMQTNPLGAYKIIMGVRDKVVFWNFGMETDYLSIGFHENDSDPYVRFEFLSSDYSNDMYTLFRFIWVNKLFNFIFWIGTYNYERDAKLISIIPNFLYNSKKGVRMFLQSLPSTKELVNVLNDEAGHYQKEYPNTSISFYTYSTEDHSYTEEKICEVDEAKQTVEFYKKLIREGKEEVVIQLDIFDEKLEEYVLQEQILSHTN